MDPVPVQDIERIRQSPIADVLVKPELRTIFLNMDSLRDELLYSNVKGKNPFKDARVRKAFYQAIDIETIKTKIMRGMSQPTPLMIAPMLFPLAGEFHRWPYDPAAARRLMAEAGYAQGFELGMDCPNDRYVNDEEICQAVAAMLSRIGVKVTAQRPAQGQVLREGRAEAVRLLLQPARLDAELAGQLRRAHQHRALPRRRGQGRDLQLRRLLQSAHRRPDRPHPGRGRHGQARRTDRRGLPPAARTTSAQFPCTSNRLPGESPGRSTWCSAPTTRSGSTRSGCSSAIRAPCKRMLPWRRLAGPQPQAMLPHGHDTMLAFAIRRLFEALMVMLAVALIAFALFRYVGDPVNQMVGQDATLEDRAELRRHLGLDDPVIVQFGRFITHAVQVRFRHLLPAEAAGHGHDRRAVSGNLRAGAGGRPVRRGARHPDGRLHGHLPRQLAVEGVPDGLADRHLAADLPDRHPADLPVRREARLVLLVRPRRGDRPSASGAPVC